KLYYEDYHDPARARNVWNEALRKWTANAAQSKDPDLTQLDQITVSLAHLEEEAGNYPRAIELLEIAIKASPNPDALRKQVGDLRKKLASGAATNSAPAHP